MTAMLSRVAVLAARVAVVVAVVIAWILQGKIAMIPNTEGL